MKLDSINKEGYNSVRPGDMEKMGLEAGFCRDKNMSFLAGKIKRVSVLFDGQVKAIAC